MFTPLRLAQMLEIETCIQTFPHLARAYQNEVWSLYQEQEAMAYPFDDGVIEAINRIMDL